MKTHNNQMEPITYAPLDALMRSAHLGRYE